MKINNPRVRQLYDYLSKVNKTAYHDEYLLANDVLAKSPLCGDILSVYLKKSPVEKVTLCFMLKQLFLFYLKNFSWWGVHLIKKLIHFLSRQKYTLAREPGQLTVIDIKFLTESISRQKCFKDNYFTKLADILAEKQKPFLYFPKFYERVDLVSLYRSMRVIRKSKAPVLTEYQLLRLPDYLYLVLFVVLYPLKLFRFIKTLGNEYEDDLLRFVLWDTLDTTVIRGYLRLLCGRRLSHFPIKKIKCISWFENQSIDKCFYRGLRNEPGKATIFGAQLFIWPDTLLNMHVDEQEKKFDIIPDKILVNGEYYLSGIDSPQFEVGPSMRYKNIFQVKGNPLEAKNILILMPYFEQDLIYLLGLIEGLFLDASVLIKFHPATDVRKYRAQLRKNIKVVDSDLYDLLKEAKIVIGSSTGALVEAVSLGIPVICIDNKSILTHSYLPFFGEGILWERAEEGSEIIGLVHKLSSSLKHNSRQIQSVSEKFKSMFFCEPTEKQIIDSFELDN
jgi:hypothetical protein